MKEGKSKLFLIISGAFIFNIIFWKEKLGVNTILFDSFVCISVFLLFPMEAFIMLSIFLNTEKKISWIGKTIIHGYHGMLLMLM